MIFDLPQTVEFGGRTWEINTDYRDVLTVLLAFDDPELTNSEKGYVCMHNLYVDFESIPKDHIQEAYNEIVKFIDHGSENSTASPRTVNWQQDANLIFAAVNRVAGCEIRSCDYLHWWTFLGFFMEIKDTTASTIFALRQKKARGKKFEKWERDFWHENKAICEMRKALTDAEKEEKDRLNRLMG